MREILFRGKNLESNKWVYGWFVPILGETDSILVKDVRRGVSENMTPFTYSYSQVKATTIGQYTGLRDRNGTMIFEGDILEIESVDIDCNTANYFGGEVLFLQDTGLFAVDIGYDFLSFELMAGASAYSYNYKIIGNIHDNKELLGNDR